MPTPADKTPDSANPGQDPLVPLTPLQRLGIDDAHKDHPGALRLMDAWTRFEAGDRPDTRRVLSQLLQNNPTLPEDIRKGVQILDKATRVDKTHLLVAAACALLFVTLLILVY